MAITRVKGNFIIVEEIKTKKVISFNYIRKAAEFLGIHHSYISKQISLNKIYKGNDYLVYKTLDKKYIPDFSVISDFSSKDNIQKVRETELGKNL